jgi:8-oxo-dGTP diphosphatase
MTDPRQSEPPITASRGQRWPRCGVSAIIFRGDEVLLVERGEGVLKGRWSPPGGHIEAGEPVRQAALRELREETGIEAAIGGLVDVHEVLRHAPDGQLTAHYLLAVFWGTWRAGEPAAGSDAAAARFVGIDQLGSYPLTDQAEQLIRRARALSKAEGD